MTIEELKESIRILRERRLSIPVLRDYRPQTRSKKEKKPPIDVDILDVFSGLFQPAPETPPITDEKGGEVDVPTRSDDDNSVRTEGAK